MINLLISPEQVSSVHAETLATSPEQLSEDLNEFSSCQPEIYYWWKMRGSNPNTLLGIFMAFKFIEESLKERSCSTDWNPEGL